MMPTRRFEGRTAFVVGGTSGVGRAVAKGFAEEGARVAILGRSAPVGELLARDLTSKGARALFFEVDATSETSTVAAVRHAIDHFGEPDILYNNAGKVIVKPFTHTTSDDWDDLWRVNVVTMINTIKAVLPSMLARGRGSIVNMASISSLTASALESAYCTTKGACIQLTRSIAIEYRHKGIRCNAVCPGFIRTEHGLNELAAFASHGFPINDGELATMQGRIMEPEETAATVLFLASDAASFVNGECLIVDNGALAKT